MTSPLFIEGTPLFDESGQINGSFIPNDVLIYTTLGSTTQRGVTATTYVSQRTDGVDGLGTVEDPRDASTATKLDAVLNGIPANTRIIFAYAVSPYLTRGNISYASKGNIIFDLNGNTIKLADGTLTSSTSKTVVGDPNSLVTSFEIRDGIIDCNNANQSAVVANTSGASLNAYSVYTLKNRATNVTTIGGFSNGATGFLFRQTYPSLSTSISAPAFGVFKDVHMSGSKGTCSHICMFPGDVDGNSSHYATTWAIGAIDGCSVIRDSGSDAGTTAFGISGTLAYINNCYTDQVGNACGGDTFICKDITISNCAFTNVRNLGLIYNGNNTGQYKRFHVSDSRIHCIGESQAWQLSMVDPDQVNFERVVVEHGSAIGTNDYYLGNFVATPRVTVKDCVFPSTWGGVLPLTSATDARFIDCRQSNGSTSVFSNNANALVLSNFASRSAQGALKTVYLAVRTDGRDGDGSINDPRDASTATKLDLLWATLPSNCLILFGEGVFQTFTGLSLAAGQRVRGVGPEKTILQLATNALVSAGSKRIFNSSTDTVGNYVFDMTIDGNKSNQYAFLNNITNTYLFAATLSGMDCSLDNVLVKNTYSIGTELFPFGIASAAGTYSNPAVGRINKVVFTENAGSSTNISLLAPSGGTKNITGNNTTDVITSTAHGYLNGDSVFFPTLSGGANLSAIFQLYFVVNKTPDTFQVSLTPGGSVVNFTTDISAGTVNKQTWISGSITNCRVGGVSVAGSYSQNIAVGSGGWLKVIVENNDFLDVSAGIFTDTHYYSDVLVQNNFFQIRADPAGAAGFGIYQGGGYAWNNWTIKNNKFILSANSYGVSMRGNVVGCDVDGNEFRRLTTAGSAPVGIEISGSNNSNIYLTRNRFDPTITYTGPSDFSSSLVWATDNKNLGVGIYSAILDGVVTETAIAIAALNIDWSTGVYFTKTLSANSTFTFSNTIAIKTIKVIITNTASNYTVTWPTVSWSGGTPPTQTVGVKTDIYTLTKIGSTIYGSVIQNF